MLGLLRLRDSVVGVNIGKERMLSNLSRYENYKNRRFFDAKCHFVVYNRDMSGHKVVFSEPMESCGNAQNWQKSKNKAYTRPRET